MIDGVFCFLKNSCTNLYAVQLWGWRMILHDDGSLRENFFFKTAIGAWVAEDRGDYGAGLLPLLVDGKAMKIGSAYVLFDSLTGDWNYQDSHGNGDETLKAFIIQKAVDERAAELESQSVKGKKSKISSIKKGGSDDAR